MKAMIFAAGVGSRLKELTRDTPKCLMQAGGKTMLEHVVDRLKSAGVTSVAINVHHHAEKVLAFVRERADFGMEVRFSHEKSLLDTGGGLKQLASFFRNEGAFIVHNADIYSTIDLAAIVRIHLDRNAIGTLAIMERFSKRGIYFDASRRVVGWTGQYPAYEPNADDSLLAFSGISVASGELFDYMPEESVFSVLVPYVNAARATGRVWGEVIDGDSWVDIGTPEQLEQLNQKLRA